MSQPSEKAPPIVEFLDNLPTELKPSRRICASSLLLAADGLQLNFATPRPSASLRLVGCVSIVRTLFLMRSYGRARILLRVFFLVAIIFFLTYFLFSAIL